MFASQELDEDKSLSLILKCPECNNRLTEGLQVCATGHGICNSCAQNYVDGCPTCGELFSSSHTFLLKQIIRTTTFPCENSSLGCIVTGKNDVLAAHEEEECDFRELDCFFSIEAEKCDQSVVVGDYKDHIQLHHKECIETFRLDEAIEILHVWTQLGSTYRVFKDVEADVTFLVVFTYFDDETCTVTVHYIGAYLSSFNYIYTIQFQENKTGLLKSFNFSSICLPLIEEDCLEPRAALFFPKKQNLHFFELEGEFNLSLKIETKETYYARKIERVKEQQLLKEEQLRKIEKLRKKEELKTKEEQKKEEDPKAMELNSKSILCKPSTRPTFWQTCVLPFLTDRGNIWYYLLPRSFDRS